MILSDIEILKSIENGNIVIDPFRVDCLGTNSYDVHLGKWLAVYENHELDAKKHNTIRHFEIGEDGFVLQPGTLYLGVKNILRPIRQSLFWKESHLSGGSASTSMLPPAKVMWAFAIHGRWKSPVCSRSGYMPVCP